MILFLLIAAYIAFNLYLVSQDVKAGVPWRETGLDLLFGTFIEAYELIKRLIRR